MKNIKHYIFVILILICLASVPLLAQLYPGDLPKPADLKFKLPKPVQFQLNNGINVFFLEDRQLPLVSVTGIFKFGSLYEPADKVGLAALLATVLRTGGTQTMSGDQIDEKLEFVAARIEAISGPEYITVNARAIKKDFDQVMKIYVDLLLHPEFRQEKIDLAKNQKIEEMRRQWDNPFQVAGMLYKEQLFGSDTPYGRRQRPADLKNISRQDLLICHERYFVPGNFYIGICGDMTASEAKTLLNKSFKGWKGSGFKLPEIPALQENADGTVYFAQKETPQANLFFGHLGIRRGNSDEIKVEVLNNILGSGGFTSRLMKEIRSNRGWTYGIRGSVGSGRDRGAFTINSQISAGNFIEAMDVIKNVIKDLQDNEVKDSELEGAKNYLINSFVFRLERKNSLLTQYMTYKLNGYPDNYLDTYADNIRKVSKQDVLDCAKKYIDMNKMIVMLVGDEKKFSKPVATLGKVKLVDLKQLLEGEKSDK
jgi:predicted Zn-dependent peptidase